MSTISTTRPFGAVKTAIYIHDLIDFKTVFHTQAIDNIKTLTHWAITEKMQQVSKAVIENGTFLLRSFLKS